MTKPRLPQKNPTSGSCNLVWGGGTQNCSLWRENMLNCHGNLVPIAFVTRPINENNFSRNERPTRSLGTRETTRFELRGRKHNSSQHSGIMTRLDWGRPRSGISWTVTKQMPHSLLFPTHDAQIIRGQASSMKPRGRENTTRLCPQQILTVGPTSGDFVNMGLEEVKITITLHFLIKQKPSE